MAEITFKKEDVAKTEVVADVPAEAKPVNQETALATKEQAANPYAGVYGEIDASMVKLPYLTLVQKTTTLEDVDAKMGNFVYNRILVLSDGTKPTPVVLTKLGIVWEEFVEFGEEDRPKLFASLAEARAAGYDNDYEAEKRVYLRADMDILVPFPEGGPEDIKGSFNWKAAGRDWALARWIVRKGAFKTTAKEVTTALKLGSFLKDGLHSGMWNLTSKIEKNAKNTWAAPYLKPAGATPADLADIAAQLIKGSCEEPDL